MYRHVITKLASVHFVANKEFGIRVQSMGENPNNVHVVGGLGIDSINRTRILPKSDLETKLGFELWPKYSMLTFHPDSVNPDDTFTQLEILLNSIGHFPDVQFIITGANADFHGSQINEFLAKKSLNSSNIIFFKSLGQQNFLSLLSESQFVLGNSSSGLLEAPTFGIPTVNIGGRQNGRPKAISVIDVDCNVTSITQGITKALSKDFQRTIANCSNPYGTYGASDKILSILESLNFKSLLPKYFIDK
jgi:GDP/UDP-N,N'-diacetylbacillosamine 2-epimerase (hydrolysing)